MIAYFVRHPTAANLLMAIFIIVGVITLPKLRRETFPDITPSEVEIRVVYPGATAQEVEEAICQRIEDAIDGVRFASEVRCEAREGVGVVTVEMEEGGNVVVFKDEITTEVEAIDDFPADTERPVIRQLGTTDVAVELLISAPTTLAGLKSHCEAVKKRLKRIPEIALVEIRGFSDHQFRVELRSESLKRYNLTVKDVANKLASQNVTGPSGTIETRQQNILIRFMEERRTPLDLEALIIKSGTGGAEVRLGSLGRVIDTFEVDEQKILLGTERAGLLQIQKTKNQDVIRVARAVNEFVERERKRYPHVKIAVIRDDSTLVVDRLQMLITNGWQGMVLVFLTLWLFFNVRLSFWVAMSLPVSFLGAFYVMPLLGLTINMMTMIGMLLALGLLMDDGIVIAENIAVHRARGKSAMQAAIDGVSEVKAGVFSSFLTTVCVLGPLTTISGDIGKVLKVIPLILIVVMAVSLVEAFAILPAHLGHALAHANTNKPGRFRRQFDTGIDWTREMIFGRVVDVLLRWRYLWLGSVVALLLLAVGLFVGGVVKFQAFPDLDGDRLVARVQLSAGSPLSRTENAVNQAIAALERVNRRLSPEQPDGQKLVQIVSVEFNKNTDSYETGPHVATINVKLLSPEIRTARLDNIITDWRKEIGRLPDVDSLTIAEPGFGPAGRPIEVRFQGDDLRELRDAAQQAKTWLSSHRGTRNLGIDLRDGKSEFRLKVKPGALRLGLDAQTMAQQLKSAFSGLTADEIQVGPESYEIDVRLNRAESDSIADFTYFQFQLSDGKRVPLSAVVDVQTGRGWSRIARVNGQRTVTVRGDIDSRVVKSAVLLKKFQDEFVPKLHEQNALSVSIEGEVKEGGKTMGSMVAAMSVGLIGVFVLLSFQFRSYIEPFVVMLAIPMALVGVILGHLIMGIDFSMPSMLGFVSLSGVVVNDSILLVLFLKNRIGEGQDVLVAAAHASRERFRAIVLTSLTTVAGLLPLMFERSLQAQVIIPLAVSIAFGMMASTVLVLLVIPCLYAILADFGLIQREQHDSDEDHAQSADA